MATETITTPGAGTYTVPAGVFELASITAYGAGGGGAGAVEDAAGGSGGGGGGSAIKATVAVTPGQQISYTVGAGGAAGGVGEVGSAGGTTTFGASASATGGAGGGISGDPGGAAGEGTVGDTLASGSAGGTGSTSGTFSGGGGGNAATGGGTGGAAGADGGEPGQAGGVAGVAPGGGGGGGSHNIIANPEGGGVGAAGSIIIEYTVRVAPSDIALDDSSIPEDASIGDTVGNLSVTDADAGDTATYSLVSDAGGRFSIDTASLKVAAALNYEAATSHTVTVRATDSYGLYREEDFVITVTDVNEAPTSISLSATSVATGSASGTTVGALTTTDADAGDSHTYSLAAAVDNASFTLTGANLKTAFLADYSARPLFTVQVTAHDAGGLTLDQNFTISITSTDNADEEQQIMSLTISTPLSEGIDTSLSASQALTVPTGARRLTVQALGQNVRCKLSGAVTASTGFQIAVGQVREFIVHPSYPNAAAVIAFEAIRFIEETSGATLVYSFFAV